MHGVTNRRAFEHHDELIATLSRHNIASAKLRPRRLHEQQQNPVADCVAMRVIEGLEVVDVDQENGQRRCRRASGCTSSRPKASARPLRFIAPVSGS